MTKDELTARAEAAGLEVESRWSKDALIEAMDLAGIPTTEDKPKAEKKAPATVPIMLFKDAWDADGERCAAGGVYDWPVAGAKALIAAKKAERADPMPGE